MNNQTETTKRKGSRVFAFLTVLCLVVAMAVPAFAAEEYTISGVWTWNNEISAPYGEHEDGGSFDVDFTVDFNGEPTRGFQIKQVHVDTGTYHFLYLTYLLSVDGGTVRDPFYYVYGSNPGWIAGHSRTIDFGESPQVVSKQFYEWFIINASPGLLPPDVPVSNDSTFLQSTTNTLPIVLAWIQSVISAIFVGEMNGFLILAAVPVAIVIVFLGARLLRRLIWGA